eukprot:3198148-Rhodomonas_salina.1
MRDDLNVELRGFQVSDAEYLVHQYALRIEAGRALKWYFLLIEDIQMLMVCSMTKGLVVYEWDFDKVVGLNGLTSVTSYTGVEGAYAYGVSTSDAAFVTLWRPTDVDLQREVPNDVVDGENQKTCPTQIAGAKCLAYLGTLSEKPLQSSRLKTSTVLDRPAGLAGARTVKIGTNLNVLVTSGLYRDELRCGAFAPVDPSGTAAAAECQDVFIETRFLSGTIGLFEIPPEIDSDGTLVFKPDPSKSGQAEYLVNLQDSGSNARGIRDAAPKLFSFNVIAVNQPPAFTLTGDIYVTEGASADERVFAIDVRPGETNDEFGQLVSFVFTYDEAWLFEQPPQVVVDLVNGR